MPLVAVHFCIETHLWIFFTISGGACWLGTPVEQQQEQKEKEHYIAEEHALHPKETESSIMHEEKPELYLSQKQEETDWCATEVTEFISFFCYVLGEMDGTACCKVHYDTCLQSWVSQHLCLSDANNIRSLKPRRFSSSKQERLAQQHTSHFLSLNIRPAH